MPFDDLRLICPRCRHVGADGTLVRHALACTSSDGPPAVLGRLDDVPALTCTRPTCAAAYPVIDGIPVIFRQPEAFDLSLSPPADLLSLPPRTLRAAVAGQPPGALPALLARLARHAWAGFHDWLGPEWAFEGLSTGVHPVELMAWLEGLGEPAACADGRRLVLGAALGREAWEVSTGATVLVDGHLSSLQAARRLIRDGTLRMVMPIDATRWGEVTLTAPRAPQVPIALLCCDVLDPPLEADGFASVIGANLVDSVSDPYVALGQSHALTAPGGLLTLTSPFAWRGSVTERNRWLEALSPHAEASAEDVLLTLAGRKFDPPLTLVARREFVWALRASAREAVVFRSTGWCLAK
jgi:uncharacterized protein YbaR (Trm112 family)